MDILLKLSLPNILFALCLVFGFWLSQAGKPYNSLLFNIHKLISLSWVVLAVFHLSKMLNSPDLLLVIVLAVMAVCVVTLFCSGALMSAGKLDYALILTIHRIASVGLGLTLAWVIYTLMKSL